MADNGLITLSSWSGGLTNTYSDVETPKDSLRDAVNVDVRTSGNITSRYGIRQVTASPGANSIFAGTKWMYWVTGGNMYRSQGGSATFVATNGSYGLAPISFLELNGVVYYSNEYCSGMIDANMVHQAWGLPVPHSPTLTDLTGTGSFTTTWPQGLTGTPVYACATGSYLYQVAYTFVSSTGEESGAVNSTPVACNDTPNIRVINIPQSTDTRIAFTRVYCTGPDGDVLYHVADVPAGTTNLTIGEFPGAGIELLTQYNSPPPQGQLIEYCRGKIYVASGNTLWWTEPLQFGIHDNTANFQMFPQRITLLKAVPDGLFISSDKTGFLKNPSEKDTEWMPLGDFQAIEGAACKAPDTTDIYFFANSNAGLVKGIEGGKIEFVTKDRLALPDYKNGGHATYAHKNGHKQILGCFGYGAPSTLQNADYTAGDVRRLASIL